MTVCELKKKLDSIDESNEITIAIETPSGYVCPDGCTIGIMKVVKGIDWHGHELVIVPDFKLKLSNIGSWVEGKVENDN